MRRLVLILLLAALPAVAADKPKNWGLKVDDKEVLRECGDCHMAFAPALLPARSWAKVMDEAATHFGSPVRLDPKVAARIRAYLTARSGDSFSGGYGPIALNGLDPQQTPTRITQTPAWLANHYEGEFPEEFKTDIGSWLNCQGCHKKAADGDYFN